MLIPGKTSEQKNGILALVVSAQEAGATMDSAMMKAMHVVYGITEYGKRRKISPREEAANYETALDRLLYMHHMTGIILPWLVGCERIARDHVVGRKFCMNTVMKDLKHEERNQMTSYFRDKEVDRMGVLLFEKQPTLWQHETLRIPTAAVSSEKD